MRREPRRTDVSRPAPATRRLRRSHVVAVLFLAALLTPVVAPAASADEIGDTREQARRVANELYEIEGTLLQLDREYSEADAALDDTNERIADAQGRVDATTAELTEQRRQFQSFAVSAYVGGNETPEFDALLTSSGNEAPQKASYLHAATGNRRDLQDQLRATGEKLDGQIADLEAGKAEAQVHLDEMSAARDASQAALDTQQQVKSQIDGELDVLVREEQARMQAELQAQAEAAAQRQTAETAARQQAAPARTGAATTNPAPAPTNPTANPGAPSSPTAPSAPGNPAPSNPAPVPVAPTPAPPPIVTPPPPPAPSGGAGAAVAAAQSALGVPYVPGGKGMSGFDCSGLTSWAWAKGGKNLPPTTYGQWAAGQRVSLDALQPGDLVFYAGVSHVGIYVGGGSIIHAPNSRSVVRYDSVYWWGPIDGAVRP